MQKRAFESYLWSQINSGKNAQCETQSLPLNPTSELAQSLAQAAAALAAIARAMAPGAAAPPAQHSLSLAQAANDFLLAKRKSGRSWPYVRALQMSLASFAQGRAARPLESLRCADLEAWLAEHESWQPRTVRGRILDISTFFNWCLRRGWIGANPALQLDLPPRCERAPEIHSPAQVAAVLELARPDPDLVRHLALRYFAGLRTSEALRLVDQEILADYVEITPAKAKTRRRRLIGLRPNLRAWLALGGQSPLRNPNTKLWDLARAARAAGIPWPKNVTRHSFCSYAIALGQSAAATALEAGHSEAVLFGCYRALVTRESALEYFSITPAMPDCTRGD